MQHVTYKGVLLGLKLPKLARPSSVRLEADSENPFPSRLRTNVVLDKTDHVTFPARQSITLDTRPPAARHHRTPFLPHRSRCKPTVLDINASCLRAAEVESRRLGFTDCHYSHLAQRYSARLLLS